MAHELSPLAARLRAKFLGPANADWQPEPWESAGPIAQASWLGVAAEAKAWLDEGGLGDNVRNALAGELAALRGELATLRELAECALPMGCGHPQAAVAGKTTKHCRWCEEVGRLSAEVTRLRGIERAARELANCDGADRDHPKDHVGCRTVDCLWADLKAALAGHPPARPPAERRGVGPCPACEGRGNRGPVDIYAKCGICDGTGERGATSVPLSQLTAALGERDDARAEVARLRSEVRVGDLAAANLAAELERVRGERDDAAKVAHEDGLCRGHLAAVEQVRKALSDEGTPWISLLEIMRQRTALLSSFRTALDMDSTASAEECLAKCEQWRKREKQLVKAIEEMGNQVDRLRAQLSATRGAVLAEVAAVVLGCADMWSGGERAAIDDTVRYLAGHFGSGWPAGTGEGGHG